MNKYLVSLHSRGDSLRHGVIRTAYTIQGKDDVDAAMRAKDQARAQFPDRDARSWFADKVEKKGKT